MDSVLVRQNRDWCYLQSVCLSFKAGLSETARKGQLSKYRTDPTCRMMETVLLGVPLCSLCEVQSWWTVLMVGLWTGCCISCAKLIDGLSDKGQPSR